MPSPEETVKLVQQSMAAYVKPREQAEHIRRVIAYHLQSTVEGSRPGGPLCLIDASANISEPYQGIRGVTQEFFKASAANSKALEEFETVRKAHTQLSQPAGPVIKPNRSEILDDKLHLISQQEKSARLGTLERHIDILSEKPATNPDFLSLKPIFKDLRPLVKVPREIVDSLAIDENADRRDLASLVEKLDKVLLKSKLLLTREEQYLQTLKSQISLDPKSVPPSAKARALDTTRNELINWIESELSKASTNADDSDAGHDSDSSHGPSTSGEKPGEEDEIAKKTRQTIAAKLGTVKESYQLYVAARKSLVAALKEPVSMSARPVAEPPVRQPQESPATTPGSSGTASYLLLPYLSKLSELTAAQKAVIAYKSQFNVALAKQLKEACQIIDHLVPESQLLPQFPWPASERAKHLNPGSLDHLTAAVSDQPDLSSQIKPWVFASDSARIATMETVAESIEDGQVGIENINKTLAEIASLFGEVNGDSSSISQGDPWADLALDLGLLGPKPRT